MNPRRATRRGKPAQKPYQVAGTWRVPSFMNSFLWWNLNIQGRRGIRTCFSCSFRCKRRKGNWVLSQFGSIWSDPPIWALRHWSSALQLDLRGTEMSKRRSLPCTRNPKPADRWDRCRTSLSFQRTRPRSRRQRQSQKLWTRIAFLRLLEELAAQLQENVIRLH